jgi:hypothetical protein
MNKAMKFSREIKYIEEFELEEGIISCRVTTKNDIFFISKKQWFAKLIEWEDPFTALTQVKHFHIQSPEWWALVSTKGYHDFVHDLKPLDYNVHKEWLAREHEMVYVDVGSHLFFDLNFDLFPRAYKQDYIGGITNEYFDLVMAENILKQGIEKGLILNYSPKIIPSYNANKNKNQSLEFTWILPKDEYNKIWQDLLAAKDPYPSVRLKEAWQNPLFGLCYAKFSKHGKKTSK